MVLDLRAALLKKQEIESGRLADFEFKPRVRTRASSGMSLAWIRKTPFV